MNLRDMNIGTRLGLGFGAILVATGSMLAVLLLGNASQRVQTLAAVQLSAERSETVAAMQLDLQRSAVAVRNMGLQTAVDGVQKDEALAKKFRASYLASKQRLQAADLSAADQQVFKQLAETDAAMDKFFKEAVDLAASFNTEQAGAIITGKIDPLLTKATADLERLTAQEKALAAAAAAADAVRAQTTQWVAVGAGLLVLLGSALLAWRLTASITQPLQLAEQAAARVAQGDLDFDIVSTGRDEAARLLAALRDMRASLSAVVANVRLNSESVATASDEISQGNNDLSARTEQQASALQQTAASMEQLGTAVRHNADNARQANQLAQGAAGVAVKGGEVVGRVVHTMRAINESSRKVVDIIGVIDGIAFQTNILALNAAVEAARAGEQGRGFAVVASEVRSLAQRSAEAAKEIKSLISASVERVEEGTVLVDEAGSTMTEIVGAIQRVTDIIGEISSASSEQSSGVSQVGQAVTQMDHATQQNAALVEQSAAAAESLKQQAQQLVEAVSVFRLGQVAT
jgi:methyl-accepting chemotaxis protein